MDNEIWKQIIGYEGYYSVSNYGSIRGERIGGHGRWKPGRFLIPTINHSGYFQVTLYKGTYKKCPYVAHLVAEAFIAPRPKECDINHKDGNKLNNFVSNLEYITHSNNLIHAYKTGLFKHHKPFPNGSKNFRAKLTEKQVMEIRHNYRYGKGFNSSEKLAKRYNVHRNTICRIIKRNIWKHI